jgi:DNA ligase (NAD+)
MDFKKFTQKINNTSIDKLKSYFELLDFDTLLELRSYYDDLYYNTGDSVIPDAKYDVLFNLIISIDEKKKEEVGFKLREGDNRVSLPYWLGSMDKIKPDDKDKFDRWLNKQKSQSYFITEKLDGVSCLLIYNKKENKISLYTRGDGKVGADISYLAPYLSYIPKRFKNDIVVRGELIMSKDNWKKYTSKYSNSRNMVSGLVNSKTIKEGINDVDFIAYELIENTVNQKKISEQFKILKQNGFKPALSSLILKVDVDILSNLLTQFKKKSEYDIDGIIVQSDKEYIRNKSGNPEYALAFKMTEEENVVKAKVIKVEWNLSKRGFLKPRVNIEPINLQGVVIKYTTGFNAKFINDNKIGPGAIINITRSGDVIPHIVSVHKSTHSDMPEIDYIWNDTEVDILPVEMDEKDFCSKILNDFFMIFNIQYVSLQTIKKFQEVGLNNILKILKASEKDFAKIEGLGEKSAKKIYENIHSGLQNITLPQLMAASSLFGQGIGVKKLESLIEEVPNLLVLSNTEIKSKILAVKGFSEITADKIVENIDLFKKFMNKMMPFISFKVIKPKQKIDLRVVFSGFRSKELEEKIKEKGGEVVTGISKKITHLVVRDKTEKTTKIDKAKEYGISIIDEFELENILS